MSETLGEQLFESGQGLLWLHFVLLKPWVFNLGVLVVAICALYLISKSSRILPTQARNWEKKNLVTYSLGILASQLIAIAFAVIYISYQLKWSLKPDTFDLILFAQTFQHFLIIGSFQLVGMILGSFFIKAQAKLTWSDLGVSIPGGTLLQVAGLPILGLIAIILFYAIWNSFGALEKTTEIFQKIKTLSPFWVYGYLSFAVLLIPVVEEVFFRGIVFSLAKKYVGVTGGIAVQALLFALMHDTVQNLIPIFFSGCVLAYVYHRSGSLLPSIGIHSLLNTLQNAFAFV